ncbi:hypothetical protein D3C80_1759520 [compost metagenome]
MADFIDDTISSDVTEQIIFQRFTGCGRADNFYVAQRGEFFSLLLWLILASGGRQYADAV